MQLGEYLGLWLQTYVQPFRAPSTLEGYQRAVEDLPPQLLAMELEAVTGLHIQAVLNRKAVKYPRAAQLIYAMLSCAFHKAERLRMVGSTPMAGVEKPVHHSRRAATLTADQLRQYLDAARGTEHYPLLLLMATCGLRRGEALGVTWAAIEGDVLHIRQQRQRIKGKGMQLRPLKSHASNRDIPLPAPVLAELQAWPQRTISGWLVDSTPDRLHRAHNKVIEAAKLPQITLHGLRHSMATAMAAEGTPIKILQGILGHSHYQLTADLYADHLRADVFRTDLDRLSGHILARAGFQGTARV